MAHIFKQVAFILYFYETHIFTISTPPTYSACVET